VLKKKEYERKLQENTKSTYSLKSLLNDGIRAREYRKRKSEEPNKQTPTSKPPDQTSSTSSKEASSATSFQTPEALWYVWQPKSQFQFHVLAVTIVFFCFRSKVSIRLI